MSRIQPDAILTGFPTKTHIQRVALEPLGAGPLGAGPPGAGPPGAGMTKIIVQLDFYYYTTYSTKHYICKERVA